MNELSSKTAVAVAEALDRCMAAIQSEAATLIMEAQLYAAYAELCEVPHRSVLFDILGKMREGWRAVQGALHRTSIR